MNIYLGYSRNSFQRTFKYLIWKHTIRVPTLQNVREMARHTNGSHTYQLAKSLQGANLKLQGLLACITKTRLRRASYEVFKEIHGSNSASGWFKIRWANDDLQIHVASILVPRVTIWKFPATLLRCWKEQVRMLWQTTWLIPSKTLETGRASKVAT